MFIVTGTRGVYDDREDWNEVCSNDRSKLEAWIAAMEDKNAKEAAFQDALLVFQWEFMAANPVPQPSSVTKDIPKWPAGLSKNQITDEMKEERAAIVNHNEQHYAEAQRLHKEWQDQVWFPAYREFCKQHGKEVPEVLDYHNTLSRQCEKIYYSIEELPEI